jgi:hypothetical protein
MALAVPEPSAFGSPGAQMGYASSWIPWLVPPSPSLPERLLRVQRSGAARSGRLVQSRFLVVKDGHPNLVGLPSPVPSRFFATVSRRCHPIAPASAGARSAETVEHRASDAPSRSSVGPSARCSDGPSRTFAAPLWCNKSGFPVPARLHRCPSHRRPSSELALDLDPRIRPPASAILTTHGHVRRSWHPDLRPCGLSPP